MSDTSDQPLDEPNFGRKPWWRRGRGIALIVIGVLALFYALGGEEQDDVDLAAADSSPVEDEVEVDVTETTPTPTSLTPTATAGPPTPVPAPTVTPSSGPTPEPPTSTPTPTPVATVPEPEVFTVDEVVDGDTLRLTDGSRIRLSMVDAPGIDDDLGCLGPEATDFTATWIQQADNTVVLRRPDDASATDGFDGFVGEVLDDTSGASLNEALVQAGFGVIDDRLVDEDVDLADRLRPLQDTATAQTMGVWGPACSEPAALPTPPAPPPAPDPEPVIEPQPLAPAVSGPFENCDAARAAGAAPVRRGDPGYGTNLDRDGDGIGCE